MSTLTAKLGLTKPDPTENVDVAILNANYDAIDAAFSNFLTGAFKNKIRNGDLSVWQRGGGPFTVSNVYTADGWQMSFVGGTQTVSRQPVTVGTGVTDAINFIRSVTAGQAAAGDLSAYALKIEGVRTFAGKQVTLSFVAVAGAGAPKIGVAIQQNFGTGGAPSATVETAISAIAISNVLTRYSVTFNVPSIAGKTLGTNNDDTLIINLWLSSGATNAARASNIGIQNATIDITDIQLELGAVATAFERLPVHAQLVWCQRYFYAWRPNSLGSYAASGLSYSTTACVLIMFLPVSMRVVPSLSAPGSYHVLNGSASPFLVTLTLDGQQATTPSSLRLSGVTAGGLTAGQATILQAVDTSSLLYFSAEL